jgi:hypothetical protein
MALNYAEYARTAPDLLERGIVKSWLDGTQWMQDLAHVNTKDGALRAEWLVEDRLPDVGFRSLNEAFTESTGTTERRATGLGIIGGLIDIDHKFLQMPNRLDEAAGQMSMKVRALGFKLADTLVNGSLATDPESFDGLLRLVTELNTRNSRQVINMSGLAFYDSATREANADAFLTYMDTGITRMESLTGGKPTFALMSENTKIAITAAMRVSGHFKTTADSFGRRVDEYMGVKLYHAGFSDPRAGTEVIGDTWDGGGYTSILFVRSGEQYVHMLQDGAMQKTHIGLTENGVWDRWMIEQGVGLRVKENGGIVRLQGLDITA